MRRDRLTAMSRNLFRYDPVIGYRFVPGLKGRVRHEGGGYLVRINAQGFRNDRDFRDAPTPGKQRILVFGDSNTAGDGVSNGKRFSDLIEAQLPGTEVYNFGLPSSGTDQQYLAFRECTQAMHYDLLLICPMVDNIRRNLQDARVVHSSLSGELALLPKPYFELEKGALTLRNSPVPKGHKPVDAAHAVDAGTYIHPMRSLARQAMRRANDWLPGLRSWSQRVRRIALPQDYNTPTSRGWLLLQAILTNWVAEARAPVAICPIPMFDHVFGNLRATPYQTRFRDLAAHTGATLIDPLEDLRAAHRLGTVLRFPTDEHPTIAGHQAIADILSPKISGLLSATAPADLPMSAE